VRFRLRLAVGFPWVRLFGRPASAEVIANLVKLGYLQPAKRYEANALEAAVARLRHDLGRDGVICEGVLPQTGIAQQRS